MATSLRSQLNDLASTFADGVLAAIRTASLDDLLAESGSGRRAPGGGGGGQPDLRKARGRLARRTQAQIEAVLAKVVYAGSNNTSYQQAQADLDRLAELEVSDKQVRRLCQRIGDERVDERDAAVAAYQALPLVQRCHRAS